MLFLTFLFTLCSSTKWYELEGYTYDDYLEEFNKMYTNEKEFLLRFEIFTRNFQEIQKHNSDQTKSWKQGVNQFTDMTMLERMQFVGSKPIKNPYKRADKINFSKIPSQFDWRNKSVITPVKNQGNCGSCWSFSAAQAIESYYALATGNLVVLSEQQILDCTPNPNQCGGTGGCGGATEELAYDQVMNMGGLSLEKDYPYVSGMGNDFKCNKTKFKPVVQLADYVDLPINSYYTILYNLANVGPLAISVDATNWFQYESGIFDGCNQKNPDLNHAVQLVFYDENSFGIRNSWGPSWGEDGYIRLAKTSQYTCGVDMTPQHGSACKGDDSPQVVCGTCGMLYSASYPVILN